MSRSSRRIVRFPNPWPPDTIDAMLLIAATSASLAPYVYRFIAAWIEDRKARKIRIKSGDVELEINGAVSEKELGRAFSKFRGLTRGRKDEEPKIILPRGADRSFSLDLILGQERTGEHADKLRKKRAEKKGRKK